MHVSRGGQLTPYGDPHGVLAETKAGLDQFVRDRAYFLWDETGRPEGRADDFWRQAQHQRFRERAYALWEREGRPEGQADAYWYRTRAFEESRRSLQSIETLRSCSLQDVDLAGRRRKSPICNEFAYPRRYLFSQSIARAHASLAAASS